MKRTVYNASFEESQNLVTDEYIKSCIGNSARNVVSKRIIGIFITLFMTIGLYYASYGLQNYSEETSMGATFMFPTVIGNNWYLLVGLIITNYIVMQIRWRQKK